MFETFEHESYNDPKFKAYLYEILSQTQDIDKNYIDDETIVWAKDIALNKYSLGLDDNEVEYILQNYKL